jgi:DNA repair exonuclease SbcCD ATPase subunit
VTWFVGAIPVFMDAAFWPVPVVAMVVYLLFGRREAINHGEIYEFADSFYYLGFALSMSSLLASLEPFGSQATGPSPQEIMHRFGLGMFTTLLGVVGRTGLQLFHRLPQETLEATNQRLQEEAGLYLEALGQLRSRAAAEVKEHIKNLRESSDEIITLVRNQVDAAQQGVAEINGERTALAAEVRGLSRDVAAVARSLERAQVAGSALTERLEALSAAVASPSAVEGAAPAGPRPLLASLAALQQRVESLEAGLMLDTSGAQRALNAFGDTAMAAAQQTRQQLGASVDSMDALTARLSSVGVAPLEAAVRSLSTQLQAVTAGLASDGGRLRDGAVKELEGALRQSATEARNFNLLLDQIATALTAKLNAIR